MGRVGMERLLQKIVLKKRENADLWFLPLFVKSTPFRSGH
jgi:hypothetical protein